MALSMALAQHDLLAVTNPTLTISTVPLILFSFCVLSSGSAYQPEFSEEIVNLTISRGRDGTFRCYVRHLGGYRVGWVKADTKAIQAIHDHVITHNPRISVSHTDHTTWNLHIHNVQEEDRGAYMCQINTDPMKYQVGLLEVVVPPDFIAEETSGDVMIPECGSLKLTCRASGHPPPQISWRREDGGEIIIRDLIGFKSRAVKSVDGPILILHRILRQEMGTILCIATNGVPPTISKRITVSVHFHPTIQVPNQLVGAPLGTDVTLECNVEAYPKSINYWMRTTGEMVVMSAKYEVQLKSKSTFEMQMVIKVRNTDKNDMGSYRCIAKNSLGEVESNIRLYEISGSAGIFALDDDDDDQQFGSADREHDVESNGVVKGGRLSLQMSLPPPRGPHVTVTAKDAAGGFRSDSAGNIVNLAIPFIIIFTFSTLI